MTLSSIFIVNIIIILFFIVFGTYSYFKYDKAPDVLVLKYLDNLESYDVIRRDAILTRHSGKVLIVSLHTRGWTDIEVPPLEGSYGNTTIYSNVTLSRGTYKRLTKLVAPTTDALKEAKERERKEALDRTT